MSNILDEILANKRAEVERARQACPEEQLRAAPGYFVPRRNFFGAVAVPRRSGPNVIAEIKRASPSAGLIRADFDPATLARAYEAGGAQALSVLTDERYFEGRLEFIAQVKDVVGLPVLRKDFIVDPYQMHESRAYGADAVLLIAEALEIGVLAELLRLARSLELWVLIEVHSEDRLFKVLDHLQADLREGVLVGINNRDLTVQRTDLATTERLAPKVPPGIPVVAESGIKTRGDVERMFVAGARALLVGESLLRQPDVTQGLRELVG